MVLYKKDLFNEMKNAPKGIFEHLLTVLEGQVLTKIAVNFFLGNRIL